MSQKSGFDFEFVVESGNNKSQPDLLDHNNITRPSSPTPETTKFPIKSLPEKIEKNNNLQRKCQARKISRMMKNKSRKTSDLDFSVYIIDDKPKINVRVSSSTEYK
jgi:hypothetical protein